MTEIADRSQPFTTARGIAVLYVLFAVISGLANIVAQELTIRTLPDLPVLVSIVVGTAVGFFVKYLLDKRWIFFDGYDGLAVEVRKILVYGIFGVLTTILFWAVELGAWKVWQTSEAKYLGAIIGLAAGFFIKYRLDKRFVFGNRS